MGGKNRTLKNGESWIHTGDMLVMRYSESITANVVYLILRILPFIDNDRIPAGDYIRTIQFNADPDESAFILVDEVHKTAA